MVFLIITTVIILSFLVFTFVKAVLSKFNNYLFTLIIEVIGAFIDFVFIIAKQEPSIPVYLIIYLFGVVIPLTIFLLEKKNVYINYILKEKFTKPENRQDFYFSIIERDNNSYWAHSRLAKYYGDNNELEKQEIEYLKLIELNPSNKENYCKLAEIQVKLKKPNQAIATLSSLLNEDPGYLEGNL
jgi:tetratricopeptide (TPR) repeat protein